MHIFSKIVAIADSFDAMTTERVYQRAVDTFPALKLMFAVQGAYDDIALKAFVELIDVTGQNIGDGKKRSDVETRGIALERAFE